MITWFEISVIEKPGHKLASLELERLAKGDPEPWGKAQVTAYPITSKERLHELYGSLCKDLISAGMGFRILSNAEINSELEQENFVELWKTADYFCFLANNFMIGSHIVESFLAKERVTA